MQSVCFYYKVAYLAKSHKLRANTHKCLADMHKIWPIIIITVDIIKNRKVITNFTKNIKM